MAKPKTKSELIEAATTNYENLLEMIANRTEEEKSREYDFSGDEGKKEAHWQRDRNLRDVLMHLYEWHQLLLNWLKNCDNEQKRPFLPEGYNWRTYGAMNVAFWEKNQGVSEEEALRRLEESHHQVMQALGTFSDEELFTKGFYPWVGGSSIGGYFISNTSSHYAWAIKKMKAHKKNCRH